MTSGRYVKNFKGKLDGKNINDFTNQLDYSIANTDQRVDLVREVLYPDGELDEFFVKYFNQNVDTSKQPKPHFNVNLTKSDQLSSDDTVCGQLEKMADYILFCDGQREVNKIEYVYRNKNSINNKKKRELSFQAVKNNKDKNGNNIMDRELVRNKNLKRSKKQKIYKRDLSNKYIKQIQDEVDKLNLIVKEIKKINESGKATDSQQEKYNYLRSKCIKALRELRYDQIFTKESLFKTINFKSLQPEVAKFVFDTDTGYYDENGDYVLVSENRIDLSNPKHIFHLIEYYSDLRMEHYEDLDSNMRYILDSLDYLIDNCDLKDFEKDVIIMQVDKLSLLEMSDNLKVKYGLDYSIKYISELFKNKICSKIAKFNGECFEDWFYFQCAVPNYKKCSKCGEVKIANGNHFSPNKFGKNGLRPECKDCFNKSRNNS